MIFGLHLNATLHGTYERKRQTSQDFFGGLVERKDIAYRREWMTTQELQY
jgi:hypothetical protein